MSSARQLQDRIYVVRASTTPRSPRLFALFLVGLVSCTLGTLAVFAMSDDFPAVPLLLLFWSCAALVAHREIVFGDETAISASIVVVCAAVVAFQQDSPSLGPTMCGVVAGVHWAHLRYGAWAKLVVNVGATGLAAAAAARSFMTVENAANGVAGALGAAALAVATYWIVNNLVISLALALTAGGSFAGRALTLVRSELAVLGFGLAGAAGGLALLELGTVLGGVVLACLLACVDIRFRGKTTLGYSASTRAMAAAWGTAVVPCSLSWVTVWLTAPELPIAAASALGFVIFVLVATLIALMRFRAALGTWEVPLAFGTVLADLPLLVVAVVGGVMVEAFGVAAALLFGVVALVVGRVLGDWLRRRRDRVSPDDQELLEAIELALMDRRYTTPHAR